MELLFLVLFATSFPLSTLALSISKTMAAMRHLSASPVTATARPRLGSSLARGNVEGIPGCACVWSSNAKFWGSALIGDLALHLWRVRVDRIDRTDSILCAGRRSAESIWTSKRAGRCSADRGHSQSLNADAAAADFISDLSRTIVGSQSFSPREKHT